MNKSMFVKLQVSITFIALLSASFISIVDAKNIEKSTFSQSSYIIENVPYVGQNNSYSCAYGSLTMIYQYYGYNITLDDLFYFSGAGHMLLYSNFKIPGFYENPSLIMGGPGIAQNPGNLENIASYFNLKTIDSKGVKSFFEKQTWDDFWLKLKGFICQDNPILTSVDPYSLPFYIEMDVLSKEKEHAGHAVVVVGFNESNNTVCINDPGTALFGKPDDGNYLFLPINIFKSAVENTTANPYIIAGYTRDFSKPVLTEKEIFEIFHKLNIEKMEGKIGSYIGLPTNIVVPIFGINALKKFKNTLNNPLLRLIYIKNMRKTTPHAINRSFNIVNSVKENMSEYLYKKENLSQFCKFDAFLFEKEAKCCKKLNEYCLEFYYIVKNNGILKALLLSNNLVKKMNLEIDKWIIFEETIIKGPSF